MDAATSISQSTDFQGFPPSGSTLCPDCQYDLNGLPVPHRCPECGFEYHLDTIVWKPDPVRTRKKTLLYTFIGVVYITAHLIDVILNYASRSSIEIGWKAVVLTAVSSLLFTRIIFGSRAGVIIRHDHMETRSGFGFRRTLHFDQIETFLRYRENHGAGRFAIEMRQTALPNEPGKRKGLALPGASEAMVKALVECANQNLERYRRVSS